jgi:hypothetical protein
MRINFLSLGFHKIHAIECRIHGYFFARKLKKTALFIEKHKLYPVMLNKDLLEVWKNNGIINKKEKS